MHQRRLWPLAIAPHAIYAPFIAMHRARPLNGQPNPRLNHLYPQTPVGLASQIPSFLHVLVRNAHLLREHLLVRADVALPNGHLALVAQPDLLSDLRGTREPGGDEVSWLHDFWRQPRAAA